jgi:hypothetical protein
MKIRGGHTLEVYRAQNRDRYGDSELQMIGTIEHVLVQWSSATSMTSAEEVEFMSTVVYCPRDAAIRLQEKDRFKLMGEWWAVIGDRVWDENHPVTGHNFGYYVMQAEMMA